MLLKEHLLDVEAVVVKIAEKVVFERWWNFGVFFAGTLTHGH